MSDRIRLKRQDLDFGVEDTTIVLPSEDCTQPVRDNRYSMIGVLLNPQKQNVGALLNQLPRDWGLNSSVAGRMVSPQRFQFVFQSKEDLELVLLCGPWSFNNWMLVTHRLPPVLDDDILKVIPFWIQIRGVPPQILSPSLLVKIGRTFGRVSSVDLDETEKNPGVGRVQVHWNVDKPLQFQRVFRVGFGKRFLLKFHYEKLRNFCRSCGMLTHDFRECPIAEPKDDCRNLDWGEYVFEGNLPAVETVVPVFSNYANNSQVPSPDQDLGIETWRYMQQKIAEDRFHVEDFAHLLFRYSNMYEYRGSPKRKRVKNLSMIPLDDGDAFSSTEYSYSKTKEIGGTYDNPINLTDDYSVVHNFDTGEDDRSQDLRLAKGKFKPEDLDVVIDTSPNMEKLFHSSKKNSKKPRMTVFPQQLRIHDQHINTNNGGGVSTSQP